MIGLTYYGLSLNAGSLAGNIYLNSFLLGLVEIPAVLLCVVIINRRPLGRRLTVSFSAILFGASGLLIAIFILSDGQLMNLFMFKIFPNLIKILIKNNHDIKADLLPDKFAILLPCMLYWFNND